jgi:hypothetical protein
VRRSGQLIVFDWVGLWFDNHSLITTSSAFNVGSLAKQSTPAPRDAYRTRERHRRRNSRAVTCHALR